MGFTRKSIYELLPAYYRSKDIEQGSPLEALIGIIADKAIDLENNIAQLYDNWFIETCEDWVVPYIGDLLGVQNFTPITKSSAISQRAYIANTLAYRRRKGIAPAVEQLANDIAGWRAHVVEFFQLLATTQYLNHIRLDHTVTPDIRSMNKLDLINSAFDSIAHSADVRHISNGRGKYNIPNIGLFIWRIQSYKIVLGDAGTASCVLNPAPNAFCFTFSPLGYDLQLFNNPESENIITHISEEINLPVALRRQALVDELETRRQALVDETPVKYTYFDNTFEVAEKPETKKHPVFEIFPNDSDEPVPPEEIFICNMEQCCTPPNSITYQQLQKDGSFKSVSKKITVAADPVTGKFMFCDLTITKARASYSYGFNGDIGSGTYNRQKSLSDLFQNKESLNIAVSITWQKAVSRLSIQADFHTIQEALDEWYNLPTGQTGVLCIMDNCTYDEELTVLMKEENKLLIIAAGWSNKTVTGMISADGLQPVISSNIIVNSSINNNVDFETKTGGQLTLNGLLIQGSIKISEGNLTALNISNCTLVPGNSSIEAGDDTTSPASNQWLQINIQKSICGPINLFDAEIESLVIEDSVIDNQNDWAILSVNVPLQLSGTTVLGKIHSKTVTAENCIFNELLVIERKQTGCIRFSYVPVQSETPRQFHCQPDLEKNTQANQNYSEEQISKWLIPSYTSTQYGHHGYVQLSNECPVQITAGADDGAEMGVFNFLKQPQRKTNLLTALNEYLRLGLEAGLFYVT